MSEVKHPECLDDQAKTLDEYIFNYFNNSEPDEVAAVIESWDKLHPKCEVERE